MKCSESKTQRKFIAINTYTNKDEKSQINNLTWHLKQLEKEEQNEPKARRRKEIIKLRVGISKIEHREMIESRKLKVGSFKRSTKLKNL